MIELDVKFTKAEWEGLLDSAQRRAQVMSDAYVSSTTNWMAQGAAEYLKALLDSDVQGISVRATGTAAKNLFVARLPGGGLHSDSHVVYEGPLTSANYYMRAGTPPQKRPPVNRIIEWMLFKGTGHFDISTVSPNITRSAYEEIAFRISGSIANKGTSVAHKPLYPGGQKRFDYVAYAITKQKMLKKLQAEMRGFHLPWVHKFVVGYWKTGRYDKASKYIARRIR